MHRPNSFSGFVCIVVSACTFMSQDERCSDFGIWNVFGVADFGVGGMALLISIPQWSLGRTVLVLVAVSA